MAFNIQNIKSALVDGGARSSLFEVQIFFPDDVDVPNKQSVMTEKISFLCKASNIPASTLSTIEVPYFGRKIKVAGSRTFAEWSVTILNDEDFAIRIAMEEWMQAINQHSSNLRANGTSSSPESYKGEAVVRQFAKDEETPIRKYKFEGCWPSEVSQIDLDWENENDIEEFTVTFQYDLWEPDNTPD